MKNNSIINCGIKAIKKLFQPKTEKAVIEPPKAKIEIPKHETKVYHEPPCSGIPKGYAKKRRAKIRMRKLSRRINRKAA